MTLTQSMLDEAIRIVTEECGGDTYRFFESLTFDRMERILEYRFSGLLGFGGKLWWDEGSGFRVTCYTEDETPERLAMIDRANRRLKEIGER